MLPAGLPGRAAPVLEPSILPCSRGAVGHRPLGLWGLAAQSWSVGSGGNRENLGSRTHRDVDDKRGQGGALQDATGLTGCGELFLSSELGLRLWQMCESRGGAKCWPPRLFLLPPDRPWDPRPPPPRLYPECLGQWATSPRGSPLHSGNLTKYVGAETSGLTLFVEFWEVVFRIGSISWWDGTVRP